MVRYIAENDICDLDGLKEFDVEGYNFIEEKSDDCTFVFDRPKPTPTAGAKSKAKSTKAKAKVAKPKITSTSKRKAVTDDNVMDDNSSPSSNKTTKRLADGVQQMA